MLDTAKLRDAFQRKRYGNTPGDYDPDFDLLDVAADEIDRLRVALKPFADCADVPPDTCESVLMYASPGGSTFLGYARVSDLRNAKKILNG